MEQLIQSSDLFVMQVEMDIYTALKKVLQLDVQKAHGLSAKKVLVKMVIC